MSQFAINDHVQFQLTGPEGSITGTGQIIKIFPAGQSFWLHVRQDEGKVRMLFEATTKIEVLAPEPV